MNATTPNLPGPVPRATTAISGERVKELREMCHRCIDRGHGTAVFIDDDQCSGLLAILDSFDALPALQAENAALKEEVEGLTGNVATVEMALEKAEAELAEARPLIEDAVDYVREHLADHLAALGETTAKNKGRADDMRRIIRAALAFRQRTERAPAGHEKEKGEGE